MFEQVDVVTITHNSEQTLAGYFAGLAAQGSRIRRVVIVDNGSSDRSRAVAVDYVSRYGLEGSVIESSNVGFAAGYLLASRSGLLSPEYPILCLNPDVVLDPNVLSQLIGGLTSGDRVGIATLPLRRPDESHDSASERRLPKALSSGLYAMFGKLTPTRLRYNSLQSLPKIGSPSAGWREIEATTGALMLLHPRFRPGGGEIFDTRYWMYGEDLQLCLDASRSGWKVVTRDDLSSLHVKGASSGLPRSWRSNRAFHDALFTYYSNNLARGFLDRVLVRLVVECRLVMSAALSVAVRRYRGWTTPRRTGSPGT